MIKVIIATLILLAFPLLSHGDMGIYEEISIDNNTEMSTNDTAAIDTHTDSTSSSTAEGSIENNNITANATSTTKSGGFFHNIMNWFKGWFN